MVIPLAYGFVPQAWQTPVVTPPVRAGNAGKKGERARSAHGFSLWNSRVAIGFLLGSVLSSLPPPSALEAGFPSYLQRLVPRLAVLDHRLVPEGEAPVGGRGTESCPSRDSPPS